MCFGGLVLLPSTLHVGNCLFKGSVLRRYIQTIVREKTLYIFICSLRCLQVHESGDDENSAKQPSPNDHDVPKLSRSSTDIVNSIKNRFYQAVQGSPSLEIPDQLDSQIRFAQLLSCLPYQALTPMACSTPGKTPPSEFSPASPASPATNVFNFNFPVPAQAESDVGEDLQLKHKNPEESRNDSPEVPMNVDHTDERKEEIFGRPCVIDDSITPERRPRAYALVRPRTPRN